MALGRQRKPCSESAAVSGIRIHTTVLLQGINEVIFLATIHNCLCNGAGHNGIICEKAVIPE